MRKGMALALAGIVAASLAAGVALLGGRVDTAAAAGTAEPTVITEHRKVITDADLKAAVEQVKGEAVSARR